LNTEHLLINAILTQSHVLPVLKRVDETFFSIDANKQILKFFKEYFVKYKKVPSLSIFKEQFPSFEYNEETGPVDFFINDLVEKRRERLLTKTLSESITKLKTEKPSDVIEFISNEMLQIRTIAKKEEDIDIIATSGLRLKKYLNSVSDENRTAIGVPTGFPSVDNLTNGFHNGELIAIMGMTGIGKSYFAAALAKNAWINGFKPLYISLEMSSRQIANRFDSLVSGLSHREIKQARLSEENLEKYRKHLSSIKEGHPPFIISNPSKCTTTTIFSKIIEYKPDICFVDYVSLVKSDKNEKDVWVRVGDVMRDLKNFASDKDINIPIIALAQVNRGFERSSNVLPELEDIAEAYAIAAHSDIVMAIHQNKELKSDLQMLFGILKNRDGEDLNLMLDWDLNNSIIKEHNEETTFND